MAGTLILLKQAGYEVHYMNIANGCCGTVSHAHEEITHIRREESRAAAAFIGAHYHESVANDMEIFYERALLVKVAAAMREVAPEILLLHSPRDYMEDHQNAARLAVSAAFCRSMVNFNTDPPREAVGGELAIYHCQPHGNCDPLRQVVRPEIYVDISSVIEEKTEMLAHHQSQKAFLDVTQGMESYLLAMRDACEQVGEMSGRYEYAEGWRRRLHYGFCAEGSDPLPIALAQHSYAAPAGPQRHD